jgi:diguanylate cyclase (GGDEF)-like protein
MDIRTLTLVNLILLFLYAAVMLVNSGVHGESRGGNWFALSNLSRGVSLLLLSLGAVLPKFLSSVAGDVFLVLGLTLLHRSLSEVMGRGKTAWNLQLSVSIVAFLGLSLITLTSGRYAESVVLVSAALAVQMALTSALLFSGVSRGTSVATWFSGSVLLLCSLLYMTRAVMVYRHPETALQMESALMATWLVASLVANGATAFGFLFLSAAQLRLELTRLAQRDALTGVLNRRGLKALAEGWFGKKHREGEPLSAVMLDLDGMKAANDTWGHECGDELLCAVAKLLVKTVGRRGAVARLGGDEFLVVLPGMAEGGAMEVAEKLRRGVEGLKVPHCRPRASFGVASVKGNSWEEAIRLSDQALYRAKDGGKNRVARSEAQHYGPRPVDAAAC